MTPSDSAAPSNQEAEKATLSGAELLSSRDQFALAEYNNLRAEINNMIGMQAQLIGLVVISFGAIVSVGFQTRNPAIITVHPILVLILGIRWIDYSHAVVRAASYIREHIEAHFLGGSNQGWEHFFLGYEYPRSGVGYLGVSAIFPGSSVVAVFSAAYIGSLNFSSIAAIATGTLITAATIFLFILYK